MHVLGIHFSHLSLLLLLHMAPKRGGGVTGRGRGLRGRGGRTPRSSRGGHHGSASAPSSSSSSSSMEEGFWRYDFLLRVLSRTAARIPLPFSFASIASELNLKGLWLRLQDALGILIGWSWKLIIHP